MTNASDDAKIIYSADVTATLDHINVGDVCEFIIAGEGRHCTYSAIKLAQHRLEKATRKRFSTNMYNNGLNMSVRRIK